MPRSMKEGRTIDAGEAVAMLERSTRSFLEILDGVSDRAWSVRPAGEAWSLAETVEHVVLTNRSVHAVLGRLLTAPIPPETPRFDDTAITASMFATTGPAPPGLADPRGRFVTRPEGIRALVETRDALVAWVDGAATDLRAHGIPHPVFGVFDGIQWILFAAAHTDNHLPQLREQYARVSLGPLD